MRKLRRIAPIAPNCAELPRTLIFFSGMLSLSYSASCWRKFDWLSSTFASDQSVFCPISRQTASITVITSAGGFAYDFTSWMSFLSSLFSASTAEWYAGIASSRSRCASAAIACASFAISPTSASSFVTFCFTSSAFAWSVATSSSSCCVSFAACASTGCICTSSFFSLSTTLFVSTSLFTPPW